jgi:hypothetical protein
VSEVYLGLDFSGGAGPWKARCAKPTVWIARVEGEALADLRPVQDLDGEGPPFERLVGLLKSRQFRAAAIDAPFSIPARHVPKGGHGALLKAIAALPPAEDRPFPRGEALFELARSTADIDAPKRLRGTEADWRGQVNIRSSLWNGRNGRGRPCTPLTVACLSLLARVGGPIWPWSHETGMLVEAFPTAQLKRWGLPHQLYGDLRTAAPSEVVRRRSAIVDAIGGRLRLTAEFQRVMMRAPDAIDAVVASFGARAAATGELAYAPPVGWELEGAMAVHA